MSALLLLLLVHHLDLRQNPSTAPRLPRQQSVSDRLELQATLLPTLETSLCPSGRIPEASVVQVQPMSLPSVQVPSVLLEVSLPSTASMQAWVCVLVSPVLFRMCRSHPCHLAPFSLVDLAPMLSRILLVPVESMEAGETRDMA